MSTNFYITGTTQATVKRAILKSWACNENHWDQGKYGSLASAGRGRVWVLGVSDEYVEYVRGRLVDITHTLIQEIPPGATAITISEPQQYERLERLGRNLRQGDEVRVAEILSYGMQYARVRVVQVKKGRRGHFSGKQTWEIHHDGLISKSPLFSNMPWVNPMICEADDQYVVFRPIG